MTATRGFFWIKPGFQKEEKSYVLLYLTLSHCYRITMGTQPKYKHIAYMDF
jgi:hypothetical protein